MQFVPTRRAPPSRRRRAAAGSALVEALVAAALVGVALLLVVALLTLSARLTARADGQRAALAALEAVLEGVRAGALPPVDRQWTEAEPPWVPLPSGRGATLSLRVLPTGLAGLWELEATIRYRAGRDPQTRTLTTRAWRPGGGP
jgi:type II secretory pathway pseudopilin PulG